MDTGWFQLDTAQGRNHIHGGKGDLVDMRRSMGLGAAVAVTAMVALAVPASGSAGVAGGHVAGGHWVDAWAASPEPANLQVPSAGVAQPFQNQTLRLVVHAEATGQSPRVRLSNAFGDRPLVIGSAQLAKRTSGASVDQASARPIVFGGRSTITIPVGADVLSDSVDLNVAADTDFAVDIYLPQQTGAPTWHFAANQTSYVTAGNQVGTATLPAASTVTSWFFLTDLEVAARRGVEGIVAFGDSITDGTKSTIDANHRWPNYLADRLDREHAAVVDEGIHGGRLLHDIVGANGLARFERDVLSKPSVKYVVSLIGVNDIALPDVFGHPDENVSPQDIEQGYQQLITRAHEKGLRIFGGTLTAIEGSVYDAPDNEAKRQQVNTWLRTMAGGPNGFDRIVDFDIVTRDPDHPARLNAAFDGGDHLHLNDTGYQAMANALDPSWF